MNSVTPNRKDDPGYIEVEPAGPDESSSLVGMCACGHSSEEHRGGVCYYGPFGHVCPCMYFTFDLKRTMETERDAPETFEVELSPAAIMGSAFPMRPISHDHIAVCDLIAVLSQFPKHYKVNLAVGIFHTLRVTDAMECGDDTVEIITALADDQPLSLVEQICRLEAHDAEKVEVAA